MAKTTRKKTTRVPKTRNANTMTEAAFWSMIRSTLRERSRWWKPISQCRKNAGRKYRGANKRMKWEYQCAECKRWFPISDIEVHHIVPAGSLSCANDLPGFVERLFCEVGGLQCLCIKCHDKTKLNE